MLKTKYITLLIITITLSLFCEKKAEFIEPAPGAQLFSSPCTLHVNIPYPVDSTGFTIEYLSQRGTIKKRRIGTLTREPFRLLLNTEEIPNQYYNGATINAEIYRGDTLEIVKASHVYILNKPIITDTIPLYQKGYTSKQTLALHSPANNIETSLKCNYNNKMVKLSIDVKSLLKKAPHPHSLAQDTITLILDPTMNRYPYVNNNTVTFHIPLNNNTQAQLVSSYIDTIDNTFIIKKTPTPIRLKKNCRIEKNGSYRAEIEIPALLIGGDIPKVMGINIIAPHPFNDQKLTLVKGTEEEQLAPILYPLLVKTMGKEAQITKIRTFLLTFLIGFCISLLLFPLTFIARKIFRKMKTTKISTIDIVDEVSKEILNPLISPEMLATKLKLPKQELQKTCYTITGKSVQNYINWLRVELIKERLVSSNSNEIDIAKSCGFKKVVDMEATFLKAVGIAPYKFREKNKVSFTNYDSQERY